jgi:hypothetical protein
MRTIALLLSFALSPILANSAHAGAAYSKADQRAFRDAGKAKLKAQGIKAKFSKADGESEIKVTVKGKKNVAAAFKALATRGSKPGTEGDQVLDGKKGKVDFRIGTKKQFRNLNEDEQE